MSAPAWARGYDVDRDLKPVAELYRQVDGPYVLGAFGLVKESTVAQWIEDGESFAWRPGELGPLEASCRVRVARVRSGVKDFTGGTVAYVEAGDMILSDAVATTEQGWAWILEGLTGEWEFTRGQRVWFQGFRENPRVEELAARAGLPLAGVKIRASSELVGVWSPLGTIVEGAWSSDLGTLVRLGALPGLHVSAAAREVQELSAGSFAQHYSSYNKRSSWSAVALRGYHAPGLPPDPEQIAKPAEMSKAWKAEHAGWESWPLEDTPALEHLPAVAELFDILRAQLTNGGRELVQFQRVRLMRLEPGGGELTRHSDITDPEAGTDNGKLARIHVPLLTNPDVRFRQWDLEGRQHEAAMGPGEVWYLDTRKPHRAGNYGSSVRIHLVADAYCTDSVRRLIDAGQEAAVVA